MKLVAIPCGMLDETAPVWGPFVEKIAKRQKCHPLQRIKELYDGTVTPWIVWDEDKNEAKALVGVQNTLRGAEKIARIVWLIGVDRHSWLHLNEQLEAFYRNCGFAGMEAMTRPGWQPELKRLGYRLTHVFYEKDFVGVH